MPDTPRTLREMGVEGYVFMGPEFSQEYGDITTALLDALIGAQGGVLYTAEDVKAVRAALAPFIYGKEFADLEFLDSNSVGENKLLPMARAAITAAGGVVADEVYERVVVTGSEVGPCARCDRWGVPIEPLDIADGDILYIVRAKEK